MRRPPVERYARTSFAAGSLTIEPGLEYERGEDAQGLSRQLRDVASAAVNEVRIPIERIPFDYLATMIERAIIAQWPTRAYFIEVHDDAGCWTQIFQPFGVPRNEPTDDSSAAEVARQMRDGTARFHSPVSETEKNGGR